MTVTEASSSTATEASAPLEPRRDNWLDTADHKRLGLLYLGFSLVALLAGLVAALVYPLLDGGDAVDVWTATASRVGSAAVSLVFVLGIAPAWIGLATYLVPLQIGATRLALPRLHAFAWWLHVAGTIITVAGYLRDRPAGGGLGSAVPAAAESEPVIATELWIVGLGLVALAAALAWAGLVTTILTRRAEGMRVRDLAPFTWSALATGVTALLAAPVFLAGLLLLYVDHHYTGPLFADPETGGLAVWLKTLWLYGRPDVYLLVAPAVGVFSEVVATAARRPLFPAPAARVALAGAAFLGLTAWIADVDVAGAAVLPTYNIVTVAAAVPFGLAVLVWLGTVAQGRPRVSPGVLHAVAFAALLGAGSLMPLVAAVVGLDDAEATAFANGQLTLVVVGPALLALAGALDYWAPKLLGRRASRGVSALAVLAVVGGTAVAALGQYLVAFGVGGAAPVTTAGLALLAAAVLLAGGSIAGPAEMGSADPYDGLTLEWLAASPPPRYNFDELPPVRSAYPLYDLRHAAEAAADSADSDDGTDALAPVEAG